MDDVEEFSSKMDQMNVHKGTIAARSGFAAGCIEFAKNSGIGSTRFPKPGVEKVLLEHEEAFSAKAILEGAPENKFSERLLAVLLLSLAWPTVLRTKIAVGS